MPIRSMAGSSCENAYRLDRFVIEFIGMVIQQMSDSSSYDFFVSVSYHYGYYAIGNRRYNKMVIAQVTVDNEMERNVHTVWCS